METQAATSKSLLSALKPRSLKSEAILLCWTAWFMLRGIGLFFPLLVDTGHRSPRIRHDVYSAIAAASGDASFMLLDSILLPAIAYGLFLTCRTARRSSDANSALSIDERESPQDPTRSGRIVRMFARIFPRLTVALAGEGSGPRTGLGEAALDTKRLAAVWLLVAFSAYLLAYAHLGMAEFFAPFTGCDSAIFEAALCYVCTVLLILWRWPHVFRLSRLRPRMTDLATGALVGYLFFNLWVCLPEIPLESLEWPWALHLSGSRPPLQILFAYHVLAIPVLEELIFRGVILGSLLKRTSVLWAVLITAVAATMLHSGPYAFLPQVVLCATYLARHRSIPASIAAHAVTNGLLWFPSLVVLPHWLK